MHHVLIRDEADDSLFRRITPEDRERLVVCRDGDLYRVVDDPEPNVCLFHDDERLCNFPQPHEHGQ